MPTTWVALLIAVLFLVPGFLADFALGRWVVRGRREAQEFILTMLALSFINYALFAPFLVPVLVQAEREGYRAYARAHPVELTLLTVAVLIVAPLGEAVLFGNLLQSPRVVDWLARWFGVQIRTIPKSWDFVFSRGEYYLVLVTLTDGSRLGAGWGPNSFASWFPHEEDIYFEVVYSLLEDDSFGDPVPLSAGILLKRADIRSLELFYITTEDSNGQEGAADQEAGPGGVEDERQVYQA